jgi:hypothetical protein
LTRLRFRATILFMLDANQVEEEIADYRRQLGILIGLFGDGKRSQLIPRLRARGDELICLLEEAPLWQRGEIDLLIDKFEALRISCMS